MTIDAHIEKWDSENEGKVILMIAGAAEEYKSHYDKAMPSNVMVVGENWAYILDLTPKKPNRIKLKFDKEEDSINNGYVPLEGILSLINNKLGKGGVALIPATDMREAEARRLHGSDNGDFYEADFRGRKITVFSRRDYNRITKPAVFSVGKDEYKIATPACKVFEASLN